MFFKQNAPIELYWGYVMQKTVYKGIRLKVYTPFNFQEYHIQHPCLLVTLTSRMLVDNQTYFESHHHQKNFYKENKLNQKFVVFLFVSLYLLASYERNSINNITIC